MPGMILYLFGIPLILFAVQLVLCLKVEGLFFRLVPGILVGITLMTSLLLTFWAGLDIPGVYLNIVLPRAMAVGAAWLCGWLARKRMLLK